MLISIAAIKDLEMHHWDVSTAFLNGRLNEEIYMSQPEGYAEKGKEHQVCRLHKAIYGLKQASRTWNEEIDKNMKDLGFKRSKLEPCIYYKISKSSIVISALYVDDFFHFFNDAEELKKVKDALNKKYKIKDLGETKDCLGVRITRNRKIGTIGIDQEEFIEQILDKFNMSECKPVGTPLEPKKKLIKPQDGEKIKSPPVPYQNLVGSLMYLATWTRPDIAHAASMLSQFNTCYTEEHWQVAKRVLRYLKGISNICLTYGQSDTITGYVDADWAGDENDRRSYTGYVFMIGDAAISWESKKQPTVALSTTEAEYMALAEAAKEAVHRKNILFELFGKEVTINIKTDNQSAMKLVLNPIFQSRTKHISVRHHFVREVYDQGLIDLSYVSTDHMLADILTKAVCKPKHIFCSSKMGLH